MWGWGLRTDRVFIVFLQLCIVILFDNNNDIIIIIILIIILIILINVYGRVG